LGQLSSNSSIRETIKIYSRYIISSVFAMRIIRRWSVKIYVTGPSYLMPTPRATSLAITLPRGTCTNHSLVKYLTSESLEADKKHAFHTNNSSVLDSIMFANSCEKKINFNVQTYMTVSINILYITFMKTSTVQRTESLSSI